MSRDHKEKWDPVDLLDPLVFEGNLVQLDQLVQLDWLDQRVSKACKVHKDLEEFLD